MSLEKKKKKQACVEFDTLIHKLEKSGVRGVPFSWINFKCGITQRVQVAGSQSNMFSVNYGIPQSSILGPIFLKIYIHSEFFINKY